MWCRRQQQKRSSGRSGLTNGSMNAVSEKLASYASSRYYFGTIMVIHNDHTYPFFILILRSHIGTNACFTIYILTRGRGARQRSLQLVRTKWTVSPVSFHIHVQHVRCLCVCAGFQGQETLPRGGSGPTGGGAEEAAAKAASPHHGLTDRRIHLPEPEQGQ